MRLDKIIYLLSTSYSENEIGDTIETHTKRKVFGSEKSIKQSEFYQAQATGLKPEITVVIRPFEYLGEELVEYEGKNYKVLRTYKKNSMEIELILEGVVNG